MLNNFIAYAQKAGFTEPEISELKTHYSVFMAQNEKQNFLPELNDKLFDNNYNVNDFCKDLISLAGKGALADGTFGLILFIINMPRLNKIYLDNQIPEWVFIDSIKGVRCKCFERSVVSDTLGIDCPDWVARFYRLTHFGLGRFQYCIEPFEFESYSKHGITVKKGDEIVAVHIPSGASLTEELRLESYKKAYDFYKKRGVFKDSVMRAICHSWMLFPEYVEKVYSKVSNLYGFSTDYDVFSVRYDSTFKDGWRVFGAGFNDEFKDLPQNSSLQKSFNIYAKEYGKFGIGYGMLLFDGEKILR